MDSQNSADVGGLTPGVKANAVDVPSAAAEITTVQPFAANVDADDGGTSAGKAVAATNETVQGGISGPMLKSKGAWGEGVDHDEPR